MKDMSLNLSESLHNLYQKFLRGEFKNSYFQLWSPAEFWTGSIVFTTLWYLGGIVLFFLDPPTNTSAVLQLVQALESISRTGVIYGLPYTALSALSFSYFSEQFTKRRRDVLILNAFVFPFFFVPLFYIVSIVTFGVSSVLLW